MTTDELLMKLPSHIGRTKFHGFYIPDNKRGGDIGWLYLHNDGKDWGASYGREGNYNGKWYGWMKKFLEAIKDVEFKEV